MLFYYRTEEQLGYVVLTQLKTSGANVKQMMILVQGDAYDPIYVTDRIEVFVQNFRKSLVAMPAEEFATNIEAVVQILTEKKKNLPEESYNHWLYISNDTFEFDRTKKIAEIAKTVTKEDVLRLFDRFMLAGSPDRRKLSVQTFGSGHLDLIDKPVPEGVHRVTGIDDFVRHVHLYPLSPRVEITDAMRMPSE